MTNTVLRNIIKNINNLTNAGVVMFGLNLLREMKLKIVESQFESLSFGFY